MTDITSDGIFADLEKVCPIPDTATSTLGVRSRSVLQTVAARHKLQISDILGRDRFAHFLDARREAIRELATAGLTLTTIARVMGRDRSTIVHHLDPVLRASKLAFNKRWRLARDGWSSVKLNAEIFRLVTDYAAQEKIGVDTAANELLRQSLGAAA